MSNKCTIQVFADNAWHDAASITLTSDERQGWKASTRAGYTLDHVLNYQGMRDAHACTYQWPVSMTLLQEDSWPPFLLDLLPQGFGLRMTHNEACTAIADASSDPEQEISEYLKRDIANVTLGNKDNHSRNTAINRTSSGQITLPPLFDFAPMYLHPDGIARAIRWTQDDSGQPDWSSTITPPADCPRKA